MSSFDAKVPKFVMSPLLISKFEYKNFKNDHECKQDSAVARAMLFFFFFFFLAACLSQ